MQRAIAAIEQLGLAMPAAVPDRAHGMDHVTCGQGEARGDARLAGGAAHARCRFGQGAAGRQQRRTGRAMDGAIHAAAAEQARIGRIDDGVRRQCR